MDKFVRFIVVAALSFLPFTQGGCQRPWHGHLGRVFHGLEARATPIFTPSADRLSKYRTLSLKMPVRYLSENPASAAGGLNYLMAI